jgi:hypothetical protein
MTQDTKDYTKKKSDTWEGTTKAQGTKGYTKKKSNMWEGTTKAQGTKGYTKQAPETNPVPPGSEPHRGSSFC